MWRLIAALKSPARAIVLTSHAMDEVERLCDEVVIIAGGVLQAQGTCQRLRQLARSYVLDLSLAAPTPGPGRHADADAQLRPRDAAGSGSGSGSGAGALEAAFQAVLALVRASICPRAEVVND